MKGIASLRFVSTDNQCQSSAAMIRDFFGLHQAKAACCALVTVGENKCRFNVQQTKPGPYPHQDLQHFL
jgi:hypothetical protein